MRKEISRRTKLLGYKYVIGELTSSATQKVILEKMGHRNCAEVNLSRFSDGNRRPFASVVDPEIIVLAEEVL
ncbi:ATP transporter ATP-binding protein [Candidatus Puniceispirillum marinum IMCC1322]|uniref:ATP transporter ATP-binding protein n=1 Tax=Puniceispirillum marinum (strain IMCC1322) TaxID=488538 RepID=D5BTF5_PUNMI|nr:ATP transporter ATP-binding protein [Candidatus Puniceispirillum marinum IMCC1322]